MNILLFIETIILISFSCLMSTYGYVSQTKFKFANTLNYKLIKNINSDEKNNLNVNKNSITKIYMSSKGDDYYAGKDAYQILEIPRSADAKEIKSAYRKLVGKWHPDKFPDDEAKKIEGGKRMEAINRAWFCLGDDDRKRRYDQYGEAGVGTSAASEEQLKAAGGPGMGGFGGMGVELSHIHIHIHMLYTYFILYIY